MSSNLSFVVHSRRSACCQVMRDETPVRSACSAAASSATRETSTAVTVPSYEASQMAVAPSPQPSSSARPGTAEASALRT